MKGGSFSQALFKLFSGENIVLAGKMPVFLTGCRDRGNTSAVIQIKENAGELAR